MHDLLTADSSVKPMELGLAGKLTFRPSRLSIMASCWHQQLSPDMHSRLS